MIFEIMQWIAIAFLFYLWLSDLRAYSSSNHKIYKKNGVESTKPPQGDRPAPPPAPPPIGKDI